MTYSIIVPTFNSAATLKDCLHSILNQSCDDMEILISDGASTDKTQEIAESFNDSRVRFFSEPDKGVYFAMNKAVRRASGEWLIFLGSDDTLYSDNVLEEMKKYLDKTDEKIVYGDVKIIGDSNWIKDGDIYRGETPLTTLFVDNICHQSICYSSEVFNDHIHYNTNYPICADYDLNLFFASRYKLKYVPIILSAFKTGGLSTVSVDNVFIKEKWINIVSYFGGKLFDKSFRPHRKPIRKTIYLFLKTAKFKKAFLAMRIYLYHILTK
jgi:glycosyltransferase involved in cell wall biosynthesis